MGLKEKINSDFIAAMKAKDITTKATLSSLKAKITEAEKANSNQPLDNDGITKVILAAAKQRKQSISEFEKAGRPLLVETETAELEVLEKYLPTKMTTDEIAQELVAIMAGIDAGGNVQRLIGQSIGTFNKKFPGMADPGTLKELLTKLT